MLAATRGIKVSDADGRAHRPARPNRTARPSWITRLTGPITNSAGEPPPGGQQAQWYGSPNLGLSALF
jgi:hypothetical protein